MSGSINRNSSESTAPILNQRPESTGSDDSDIIRFKNGYSPRAEAMKLRHLSGQSAHLELQILSPKSENCKKKSDDSSSSSYSLDDKDLPCCPCCPSFHPGHAMRTMIEIAQNVTKDFFTTHKKVVKILLLFVFLCLYFSYFTWAVLLDHNRAFPLIIITCSLFAFTLYSGISRLYGEKINNNLIIPITAQIERVWFIIKWIVYLSLALIVSVYITIEVDPHPRQLISLLGMVVFLFLLFIFSKHPGKVNPRPVLWGITLQFIFAVLILRTSWGLSIFHWLGHAIRTFLDYSDHGARFVFGEKFMDHFFAFKVLSVVIFFSSFISILYHLGIMQFVVMKVAWVMQKTMQTAATESLIAASNIFIGQSEAPVLVRPFISTMTKSELHAMMTAGFATIAGGVMAAYIMFGIPAEHLICASVMNAPIALAASKLFYPETEKTMDQQKPIILEKGQERNILEAACTGASQSISLVANIAANLIAFLALLAFVNASISWFGSLVDHPEWTFQLFCSYTFIPIAFLMGTDWQDCQTVAELLGIKIFLNEFIAYQHLGKLIENRENGISPQISVRSETIVTYALCGFANLSSIAIQLGGIGPMAPNRRGDLAELAVRALIAGTSACFITACMAGVLTIQDGICPNNSTLVNSTCVLYTYNNTQPLNSSLLLG